MSSLPHLFPENDYALLAVIVVLPLLGAIVNGVFGKRLGQEAVTLTGLGSVGLSFLGSLVAFFTLLDVQADKTAARFTWHGWQWMSVELPRDGGSLPIEVALSVDALSGTMALIVTGVGFLIHLYSTKYMEHDDGYHRFFAYLNLFIFSMLVLILGDNLPILFVGWEGVGLCSYLLIGFWYGSEANAAAGKKAFIANRIGDFGLLVAMALLVYYCGALDWTGIDKYRDSLIAAPQQIWPIGNRVPLADWLAGIGLTGIAEWISTPIQVSPATLVGLFLFLGCAGKSAQIPLYVWLPDAMAGPTPVSALIHAATMVTAGVYLVCRMAGVFVLSPAAMFVVAFVGVLTALLAASIALVQRDIKKVLAYSTVSQLGYMFMAVGVGAFAAGFFHVITHAFFKACLFLGAGSVIHAMHARVHDTDASQDMGNMGGLRRYMPLTFATFAASWAAIIGVPGTSGFFSKDEILFKAYTSYIASPTNDGTMGAGTAQIELFQWPSWASGVLFWLGVAGAVMTAFYMSRLVAGIFFGDFKGWKIVKRYKQRHEAEHADAHAPQKKLKGPVPHESPWQMTAPLVILGALALVGGVFNAHAIFHFHPLDDFLAPVFERAAGGVRSIKDADTLQFSLLMPGILALVVGAGTAYWMYIQNQGVPAKRLAERFPRLYRLAVDKFRVDEFYEETVLGSVDVLASAAASFDKWVVDGIVARFTSFVVQVSGTVLRYAQTGRAQAYAAMIVFGLAAVGWFFVAPHARVELQRNDASGSYVVKAAPGFGYLYRWDADGDGKWDKNTFSSDQSIAFSLDVDQRRTVQVAVRNAFGRVAREHIEVHRPKHDASGFSALLSPGRDHDPPGRDRNAPGRERPMRAVMPSPEMLKEILP